MKYSRDADERLINELQSKKLLIKEQETKMRVLEQQSRKRSQQISNLSNMNDMMAEKHANQIIESNEVYVRLQQTNRILEGEIKQLKQTINYFKSKIQNHEQSKQQQIRLLKSEIELNKSDYTNKIKNLQQNIYLLKKTFNVQQVIEKDRQQTIKDSSKDKDIHNKGIILQSKQLSIQLQNQSQQIVIMLQKIQKYNQQIHKLKRDLQIQKQVELGLVKRSTNAQNMVRQLHQKIKQLQINNESLRKRQHNQSKLIPKTPPVIEIDHKNQQIINLKAELNILHMQNSKQNNQINYLYNKIRLHESKFQGLATILSQHLQNILLNNSNIDMFSNNNNQQLPLEINLNELRNKDIVEWKPEETATIVYLLLTQIKSVLSKKNLISLPDLKNPNISIVDETVNKQTINLPKISMQYNQILNLQQKKPSRFKGIPLDISTKIVRSQLRNWGVKVGMQKKNNKSLSMYSKNASFM